jgi:hypothetical protein
MSSHSTKERLKEFGSILVEPERKSPEYLQKFIQSDREVGNGDQSSGHKD